MFRNRGQRDFPAEGRDLESDCAAGSGFEMRRLEQFAIDDLDAQAISGRTVQTIPGPGNGRVLNCRAGRDLGRKHAITLVVAQHTNARQEGLLDAQVFRARHGCLGRHAVEPPSPLVRQGDGVRLAEQMPGQRHVPLKPDTGAAVTGGESDNDAGILPSAQQQMGGDRTFTQKAVEIDAIIDGERQPLRGFSAARRGERCRHRDGGHHQHGCAQQGRIHEGISSKKISSEDEGRRRTTSTPSCISLSPASTMAVPASWNLSR